VDRKYITMLANSNYFVDYVEAVLLDERTCLNNPIIYSFLSMYFPKVTVFLASVLKNIPV
jgi:ubiquitin carboxyl-terminal hydrolase 34